MKNKKFIIPLLLTGTLSFTQQKITKKNGEQFEAKIIEIGSANIVYKDNDLVDGPTRFLPKAEILRIDYENGKSELLGKHTDIEDTKKFIVQKIEQFGIDRYSDRKKLQAEFDGSKIKINAVSDKGKIYDDNEYWDLAQVMRFHKISIRKDDVYYLNIVTHKTGKTKSEVDKLVIKMKDLTAAEELLEAMQDLNMMYK